MRASPAVTAVDPVWNEDGYDTGLETFSEGHSKKGSGELKPLLDELSRRLVKSRLRVKCQAAMRFVRCLY